MVVLGRAVVCSSGLLLMEGMVVVGILEGMVV